MNLLGVWDLQVGTTESLEAKGWRGLLQESVESESGRKGPEETEEDPRRKGTGRCKARAGTGR